MKVPARQVEGRFEQLAEVKDVDQREKKGENTEEGGSGLAGLLLCSSPTNPNADRTLQPHPS